MGMGKCEAYKVETQHVVTGWREEEEAAMTAGAPGGRLCAWEVSEHTGMSACSPPTMLSQTGWARSCHGDNLN